MLVRALAFLFPLLLVLPFDPQWVDFERARRGLAMLLVGAGLVAFGVRRRSLEPSLVLLAAFGGFALLSIAWASDRGLALEHAAYLAAAAMCPLLFSSAPARHSGAMHDDQQPSDAQPAVRAGGEAGSAHERTALSLGAATTLILVAIYGLLQARGWMWPLHYTVPSEPVSTLGNTNYAAESCAMLALLGLANLRARARWIGIAALLLGASYLWTSGSRAGLVAIHVGALTWALLALRAGQVGKLHGSAVLAALVAAIALGLSLRPMAATAEPSAPVAATERPSATAIPSTLEVRFRIWPGALRQAKDALPLGVGAGNFRVAFPRYRDHREIQLSSRGHEFGTRVTTAHNDFIQVLVDLGLVGILLLGAFGWGLVAAFRRAQLDPSGFAALAAFIPIAAFRAPLYNAASALVFVLALCDTHSAPAGARSPSTRSADWFGRFAGVPLLLVASVVLVGENGGADFLRAKRTNDPLAGAAALDQAVTWDPFDERLAPLALDSPPRARQGRDAQVSTRRNAR